MKVTLEQSHVKTRRRTISAEGVASAKALWWEPARHIWGTVVRRANECRADGKSCVG